MVQVVAIINADTKEMRDQLLVLVQEAAGETRLEDGCVSYNVFTSGSRRIVFLEEWASSDALSNHAAGATFTGLMAALEEYGVRDSLQVLPISPVE